jgi:hypothetical protein
MVGVRRREIFLDKCILAALFSEWDELWYQDLLLVAVPVNARAFSLYQLAAAGIPLPLRLFTG